MINDSVHSLHTNEQKDEHDDTTNDTIMSTIICRITYPLRTSINILVKNSSSSSLTPGT